MYLCGGSFKFHAKSKMLVFIICFVCCAAAEDSAFRFSCLSLDSSSFQPSGACIRVDVFPFVSHEGALSHPSALIRCPCPCPSHSSIAGGILCGLHRMSITFVYCTRRTIISPSFNEQVPCCCLCWNCIPT